MKKIYVIDYIRAVACILIMLYHFTTRFYDKFYNMNYQSSHVGIWWGYHAVAIFFVLSGFLTVYKLNDRSPGSFLLKRAVRLYPSYWLGIIFTSIITLLFAAQHFIGVIPTLINFTMFQSFAIGTTNVDSVYWTLRYELQFYIVIALILEIKKERKIDRIFFVWLILTMVNNILYVAGFENIITKLIEFGCITDQVPIFIIGASSAMVINDKKNKLAYVNMFMAIICMIIRRTDIMYILITCLTIVIIFIGKYKDFKFKYDKPIVFIAGISYEIYLIHQNFGYIMFDRFNSWFGVKQIVLLLPVILTVIIIAYGIHKASKRISGVMKNRLGI